MTSLQESRTHKDYEARRQSAQLAVKFADRLGEEVPEEVRRLAQTPSAQTQIDKILSERAEDRAKALSRSKDAQARGHHDGSRVDLPTDDPISWWRTSEQTLAQMPQFARHAKMANRGKAGDAGAGDFARDCAKAEGRTGRMWRRVG